MTGSFFLTNWFFLLIRWLYDVFGNYFLTILLITLALRLVQILPDISSRKTQRKQAAIQPELQKLQEKYKDNPQKLNTEQRKVLKANGVSMLGGCLPMLLTLPLFFCFLAAFRHWGYEQTVKLTYETIKNPVQAQETFDSYKFLWINNIWQPDSIFKPVIPEAKEVKAYGGASACSCSNKGDGLEKLIIFKDGYTDIAGVKHSGKEIWDTFYENGLVSTDYGEDYEAFEAKEKEFMPTKEAQDAYTKLMDDAKYGVKNGEKYTNGLLILPILAAALQAFVAWFTQMQSKKMNPTATQQGMGVMMWVFPIMSFFVCLSTTSAFSLYWVLSSVLQVISSTIMNKIMDKPLDKGKKVKTVKAKKIKAAK